MSDHLDERIPRGDRWPQPKPQVPHNEQPEAKPYREPHEHGFCPFAYAEPMGPVGETFWTRPPCDPAGCQIGLDDPGCCSIKNLAATIDAHCAAEHDRLTEQRLTRETLSHLSDRLAANLQSIHSNQTRLIDLAKSFDESNLSEQLGEIDASLCAITAQLERLNPPAETAEPT